LNNDNEIQVINFDVISPNLSETSFSTVRRFRFLREQAFFKEIEKPNYIVWADCGKHFRNKLFIGYLFNELSKQKINGKNIFVLFL
jgi:hypothetical protein